MSGKSLLIYICNFHVISNLLLIYICKLHWNRTRRVAFSGVSKFKDCRLSVPERLALTRIVALCEKDQRLKSQDTLVRPAPSEIEEHEYPLTDSEDEREYLAAASEKTYNPITKVRALSHLSPLYPEDSRVLSKHLTQIGHNSPHT